MSKTNFFLKYLKSTIKFINNLLEENLNKLNFKNIGFLLKNNKIILTFVAVFVIFISYLLLPTFYNQLDISKKLKTELQNKFDLNFKFSKNIKYNIFPKPHFIITKSFLNYNQNEISKIEKLKIYISINNLLSIKNIKIKDLIIEKANFDLNNNNYNFFLGPLKKNFKDGNLIIKNSNIFFRNLENDVLFINKILKMKYYYDAKELKNIFYSDSEIFNIPFSMEAYFNEDKSKIYSYINLNLIKFRIENELNFKNKKKIGKSEFVFNKLKRFIEYEIEKSYFKFHIYDKIDEPAVAYKGKLNLKPFYADLDGNLDEINLNYLFSSNAIITQLLKTEIFNNKNINFQLNIIADKIYKNINFRNIDLKSKIQDGLIDLDNSKFKWKNYVHFELLESLIFVRDGELVLDGRLKMEVKDYNELYKYLLTPKNYRNKFEKIDLNFTYNFDKKTAELKDIKIDNKINQNINQILNNVIFKKDNLENKIYFKNLLNEAIKSYAG